MARRSLQLDFALREPRRWGGRRPRAGRKPGPNRGLPHTSRQDFSTPLPAHVTMRVGPGVPSLRTVAIVRAVERSFADACARPGFRLVHYSPQGNHAHLIVEARDRRSLGCGMKAIAGRIARRRESRRAASRKGLHGSVPSAPSGNAARGPPRASLRAVERAPPSSSRSCRGEGRRALRPGIVGTLVRRMERQSTRRDQITGTLPRSTGKNVAPPDRLASSWLARPRRCSWLNRRRPGEFVDNLARCAEYSPLSQRIPS